MTRPSDRPDEQKHQGGPAPRQWLAVVFAAVIVGGLGWWAESVFAGLTAAIATAGVAQQFLK